MNVSWVYEGQTYDLDFQDKEHSYKINGVYVVGCTSVTGILPKGKVLQWWASRLACEKMGFLQHKKSGKIINKMDECIRVAGENLARVKEMSVKDYMALLGEAYKAHAVSLDESADLGTIVHGYCEAFIKNGTLPPATERKEVLNSFGKFLKWTEDNKVEWIHSELIVGSHHMFGGKFDAVAKVNGLVTLIDFKTSNGIYELDYATQLSGYQIAYEEMGREPSIHQRMILWIPKTGDNFKAHIIETPLELGKQIFFSALALYKCMENYKRILSANSLE